MGSRIVWGGGIVWYASMCDAQRGAGRDVERQAVVMW